MKRPINQQTKQTPNYITPQGLEKLRQEYRHLHDKERPTVVSAVAYAAALGDRSENADYIYGKRRLREIDRRLGFLQKRMEKAQIVDPKQVNSTKVLFGATVTIEDENGNEKTYRIVGEDEIDATLGHVSWKSPIATALLGKTEGDQVTIKRPNDTLDAEIITIEYK